jgi:hypothetical protein
MTIYGPNGGVVVGQPISPNFGAQNGASPAGGPVISQPTEAPVVGGMQATGVQMSVLEACSRGLLPRNALVASVATVPVSVGVSILQGDSASVDELLSSGNGAQVSLGVAVPPNASTPNAATTAGVNNQIFVEGIGNANDGLSTGPTPTNNESLTSAPVPGSVTTANVSLIAGAFAG